jgi:hypothetical protein
VRPYVRARALHRGGPERLAEPQVEAHHASAAHQGWYEALLAESAARQAAAFAVPAAPVFVGQAEELAILDAEHRRAVQGEARVVMMSVDLGDSGWKPRCSRQG